MLFKILNLANFPLTFPLFRKRTGRLGMLSERSNGFSFSSPGRMILTRFSFCIAHWNGMLVCPLVLIGVFHHCYCITSPFRLSATKWLSPVQFILMIDWLSTEKMVRNMRSY